MNPEDIARLITEDAYSYDRCPSCGSPYATVVGDEVACTDEDCTNYNEGYAHVIYDTERRDAKVTGVYWDLMELDWDVVVAFIDRGKMENYGIAVIPNTDGTMHLLDLDGDDEDIDVLVFWNGNKNIPPFVLRRLVMNYVFG